MLDSEGYSVSMLFVSGKKELCSLELGPLGEEYRR